MVVVESGAQGLLCVRGTALAGHVVPGAFIALLLAKHLPKSEAAAERVLHRSAAFAISRQASVHCPVRKHQWCEPVLCKKQLWSLPPAEHLNTAIGPLHSRREGNRMRYAPVHTISGECMA